jgi:hypothetical protein
VSELDPRWEVSEDDELDYGPSRYAGPWQPLRSWFSILQTRKQPRGQAIPAGASAIERDYIRTKNAAGGCSREALFLIGLFTGIIPLAILAFLAVAVVLVLYGLVASAVIGITDLMDRRREAREQKGEDRS